MIFDKLNILFDNLYITFDKNNNIFDAEKLAIYVFNFILNHTKLYDFKTVFNQQFLIDTVNTEISKNDSVDDIVVNTHFTQVLSCYIHEYFEYDNDEIIKFWLYLDELQQLIKFT